MSHLRSPWLVVALNHVRDQPMPLTAPFHPAIGEMAVQEVEWASGEVKQGCSMWGSNR